jgi:phosphatidate cytidylyltransferase
MGVRIVSGIILAALTIVIIAHGGIIFFFVAMLLGLFGLNEFYRMTRSYRPLAAAGFVSMVLICWAAWFKTPVYVLAAVPVALFLVAILGMIAGPKPGVTVRMAITFLGLLYLGLGISHMLLLRRLPHGSGLLLTVVFGTWAGDTLAYFTGRFFGSRPMAPNLSPKKTWEGLAGGTLGTVLMVVFLGLYNSLGPVKSLALGVVIAVVGPLGDLFESLLKRDVGVKDAGRFMPGHGGVLDRFDALLFATVASYYVLTLALHV